MLTKTEFDALRLDLSIKCKNGIDFITAASIIWALIAYIWTFETSAYNKSIYTFMVGAGMLPLAFLFSKIYKTQWKNPENPLDSLGLILNFAQLFYFPFLFFFLGKMPDFFVMAYVIITAAHFFPYFWYYKTPFYAIFAGIISISAFLLAVKLPPAKMFFVPLMMSTLLAVLAGLLWMDFRKKVSSKG